MSGGGTVVFIYGPPAVGKLTVASLLAERTGFKLSHNHAIIDAVLPVFGYGTKSFRELVNRFREDIIDTAVRERIDFVMTYGYVAEEEAIVTRYVELVEANGGKVLFVQLTASRETLTDRVALPSRAAHGKLTDPTPLREMLDRWDFTASVPFEPNLAIDTETVAPEEAAKRIVAHYGLNT
jgi:broad-specificity NMP kinase